MLHEFTSEQRQFIDECLANPKMAAWLSKYRDEDVPNFLAEYHLGRQNWLAFGKSQVELEQYKLTQAMTEADEVIYSIQQKKLFDLQCLWRAEKEDIEGVRFSGDFARLEMEIATLDIITPISEEDIQVVKDYLLDYPWSKNKQVYNGWQDYGLFIDEHEESKQFGFPNFYAYVAERTRSPKLWRLLPDIRGKKESRYFVAALKARYEKSPKEKQAVAELEPVDARPMLYVHSPMEAEFAKLFDTYATNECRKGFYTKRGDKDFELEAALETLKYAGEQVKVEEGIYWLDAIKQAAFRYEREQLVAAIDGAYENYLFRRKMGISQAKPDLSRSPWVGDPEGRGKEILDGREALGEPRDFNF